MSNKPLNQNISILGVNTP